MNKTMLLNKVKMSYIHTYIGDWLYDLYEGVELYILPRIGKHLNKLSDEEQKEHLSTYLYYTKIENFSEDHNRFNDIFNEIKEIYIHRYHELVAKYQDIGWSYFTIPDDYKDKSFYLNY